MVLLRYDTRCYFNVRSKADMSRLMAKFHYTDMDFFAAKLRWVRAGPFRRKKFRVRVRVGPVSVSV